MGGEVGVYLYFFFNLCAGCRWVVNATPRPLYPRERDCTLYRRLGGCPGSRSEWERKISLVPGFDPRTAQPVANRSIDWAIPAYWRGDKQYKTQERSRRHSTDAQGRPLGGASGALAPGADFEGAPKRQSPTGHTLTFWHRNLAFKF
jgi:hypothetical protein